MKRSKFSEEQIAYVLRQVEAGTPVADACRQMAENVSPCLRSPVSKPFRNQRTRWADVPCVNESGVTRPVPADRGRLTRTSSLPLIGLGGALSENHLDRPQAASAPGEHRAPRPDRSHTLRDIVGHPLTNSGEPRRRLLV